MNTRSKELENLFIDEFLRMRDDNNRDNSMTRISSSGEPECKIWNRRVGSYCVPNTAHQMYTFSIGHAMHETWQLLSDKIGITKTKPYWDEHGNIAFHGLAEIEVSDPEMQVMGHFDLLTRALKDIAPSVGTHHYIVDFKTISNLPKLYYKKYAMRPFIGRDGKKVTEYWKRVRFNALDGDDLWLNDHEVSDPDWYFWTPDTIDGGYTTEGPLRVEPGDFTRLEKMKDEHRMQATEYAHLINEHGLSSVGWPKEYDVKFEVESFKVFPKVEGIIIIYLAKDYGMLDYPDPYNERNCPIKVFVEKIDNEIINSLQEKYKHINSLVKNNEQPKKMIDKDGKPMHFPCHYCEYRHICWPKNYDKNGRPKK